MPEAFRQEAAASAARILISHPVFQASRHIACYHAFKNEFETKPLMEAIWQAGKICYLPILTDVKALHFVKFNQGDELQLNQYSIPEPVNIHNIIHAERLDLAITPLVAFDKKGNRVGTGGGFYDRTFAFLFNHPHKAPFILGLGYQEQECEDIHADPWDIKLSGVLTESALIQF